MKSSHFIQKEKRMYSDLAWTWSIISPKEDYIPEASEISKTIESHTRIKIQTLLHLGCGGGHLDYSFKKYYKVTGVDISKGMLSLAKKLNPEIEYIIGDMRTVRLNKTFDAVVIADSIDYMLTEKDLSVVFKNVFKHLKPGGVFYTYAEETKEHFKQNSIHTTFHKQGNIEINLIENYYDPDPTDTIYDAVFIYLIRKNGRLKIEKDFHQLGIFKQKMWTQLLKKVGFKAKQTIYESEKIPAFIGIKPK
jgi:SAM-dependent methyltransferase